ncbi:MAG TPA: hypothetical protein VG650_08850 [Mycobacteriales bacterium]|nr:hypothetical protein [Mycobacteriales bacterium]
MRWNRLFADLEAQLEAAADDELDAEVADRTRRELAATTFEGRLRAAAGRVVELSVIGAGRLVGQPRRVGRGWLLLQVDGGPPAVVATGFVAGARDLPVAAREYDGERLATGRPGEQPAGLAHVLRVLARDRTATAVVLVDGTTLTGTIDRVGTDYLDLAEHSLDEPRRSSAVRAVRTVAFSTVAVLRPRLE